MEESDRFWKMKQRVSWW